MHELGTMELMPCQPVTRFWVCEIWRYGLLSLIVQAQIHAENFEDRMALTRASMPPHRDVLQSPLLQIL